MSPFKTLYEVLEAPHLAVYDDLKTLFDKRDEVFEKVNAETRKLPPTRLLAACSTPTSGAPRSRTSAGRPRTRR